MNLFSIKNAYFLGIGGIGMSAIARYFNHLGIHVMGYDKTSTPLTKELESEGIDIHYDDLGDQLEALHLSSDDTLVVLTPAIPKDHREWAWFKRENFKIQKRSEVLGLITAAYKTIAVAGTHGKTTTSSLIAHMLKQSSLGCSAFLGGISTNYHTNLLLNDSRLPHSEQWMVVEADEFDRSFLTLHPTIGIITSTDADHLDIYGEHQALKDSFKAYAAQVSNLLIIKKELELADELKEHKASSVTYSVKQNADGFADNIRIEGDKFLFDFIRGSRKLERLYLGIPGLHNVENAVAAIIACLAAGMTEEEVRRGLASFTGVKRRFEYIVRNNSHIYIDDYAHHPEELRAFLSSVKQLYPDKELVAIFQPHLYTRTRDFAIGFSESLSIADEVNLLDIYPARELPIPGITSTMLLDKITAKRKKLVSKEEVIEMVKMSQPPLLVTVGAGDIDQLVNPIKNILEG